MASSQTSIVLPPPHHPFVDLKTGKIDEVWHRTLSQLVTGSNTPTLTFDQTSPTTTEGDIIYYTAGANTRLGIGSLNQRLTSNGTDPIWDYSTATYLGSFPISNQGTIDIAPLSTNYAHFRIIMRMIPQTDARALQLLFSTDGGSTYDNGAGNYGWINTETRDTPATNPAGSASDTVIQLARTIGNGSNEGLFLDMMVFSPQVTTMWTRVSGNAVVITSDATPALWNVLFSGVRRATQDTDGLRFQMDSGNLLSGAYRIYGYT